MATHNKGNEEKLNRGLKWEKKFKGKQVVGQKTNNGNEEKVSKMEMEKNHVRQCWCCHQHLDCGQMDFRSPKVVGQKI